MIATSSLLRNTGIDDCEPCIARSPTFSGSVATLRMTSPPAAHSEGSQATSIGGRDLVGGTEAKEDSMSTRRAASSRIRSEALTISNPERGYTLGP